MGEQTSAQPDDHEFRVTLKGVHLPDDRVAAIDRAIHQAVLHQLSELDLAPGFAVRFVGTEASPQAAPRSGRPPMGFVIAADTPDPA